MDRVKAGECAGSSGHLAIVGSIILAAASSAAGQVSNLRITEVDALNNQVEITNFGPAFTTGGNHPFCHRLNYASVIPFGTNFAAGEIRVFNVSNLNNNDSDLWLYNLGLFATASDMIHGVKYGPAANIGRMNVAVTAGLWPSTTSFVPTPPAGMTIAWDGFGFHPADWYINETPSMGEPASTDPGTIPPGLAAPSGTQNFEDMLLGDEVIAIDGWIVVDDSAHTGLFTIRAVMDVLSDTTAGLEDSTRWLRIRDQDDSGQNRFYTNALVLDEPSSYVWRFAINLEQSPPGGGAVSPRLTIQHPDGGFANVWGIEFTPDTVNLFVIGNGGPNASTELYSIVSPNGIGDWVEIELTVDIDAMQISASANGQTPVALPIEPAGSVDLSVFRLCYRGEGEGNVNTMLLDNVQVEIIQAEPCPGDANGDGVVNVQDLLLVIANWGSTGPDGDVNGDGIVNVQDLLLVISNWGSSCE